jgi:PhnB protein
MQLTPYVSFDGQCEAAFKFYEQALGAKIVVMLTWGGSPMAAQMPAEWQHKIIHARLQVGDQVVMASDGMPGRYEPPKGCMLTLGVATAAEVERVFAALAEGGTSQMAPQKTFFAAMFGMLTDRFGIPWMVICEKEA